MKIVARTALIGIGLVGLVALVACGSASPPTHQLAESKAAVRAAEEVGAPAAPKAALHLKLARDQIARAENLMREKEFSDAKNLLRRAEADAELAIALAKAHTEREAAEEAMRKVQRLKRQTAP